MLKQKLDERLLEVDSKDKSISVLERSLEEKTESLAMMQKRLELSEREHRQSIDRRDKEMQMFRETVSPFENRKRTKRRFVSIYWCKNSKTAVARFFEIPR